MECRLDQSDRMALRVRFVGVMLIFLHFGDSDARSIEITKSNWDFMSRSTGRDILRQDNSICHLRKWNLHRGDSL